jgi:tetratricopeptide (TPR) repeat protein
MNWLLAIACFLPLSASGPQSGAPDDLAAAERDYRAGRYDLALAAYERRLASPERRDARVLYNAGNCAYRLGKYTDAALYYRRALRRAPRDAEARFNLSLAEKKLAMAPPPPEGFVATARRALLERTPGEWLFLASAFECAGLLLIVAGRRRRAAWVPGVACLAVAGGLAAGYVSKSAPSTAEGLVMANDIRIYSEPREDLPVLLTLKAGEVLAIEESTDRWMRVRYGDRAGWTPRAGIGVID